MRDITTPKTETNNKNTPFQKVEEYFSFFHNVLLYTKTPQEE